MEIIFRSFYFIIYLLDSENPNGIDGARETERRELTNSHENVKFIEPRMIIRKILLFHKLNFRRFFDFIAREREAIDIAPKHDNLLHWTRRWREFQMKTIFIAEWVISSAWRAAQCSRGKNKFKSESKTISGWRWLEQRAYIRTPLTTPFLFYL